MTFGGFQRGEALARQLRPRTCWCFQLQRTIPVWSTLEAMACGVPVTAYPVAGNYPVDWET